MKKRILLVTMMVVVMTLVSVVPASACTEGCTPGYWKQDQHFDSWVGYSPTDLFSVVFGVGPDMTLLEALSAQKKDPKLIYGTGPEAALLRHAVAALLNANAIGDWWTEATVIQRVNNAYTNGNFEFVKDAFAAVNELDCPLN